MTGSILHRATALAIMTALPFVPTVGAAQSMSVAQEAAETGIGTGDESDPFAIFAPFAETELGDFAGGASLDLGDVAVNLSDQTAGISDTSMIGQFENGDISRNTIEQLSGINSLMFNTGNNVNFQSSIQVNVFVK